MTGVLRVIDMLGATIEQLQAELAAATKERDELRAALAELARPEPGGPPE